MYPQDLCNWIRNNWQLKKSVKIDPTQRRPSWLQVVWHCRGEEVDQEINDLHERAGNQAPATAKDWFWLWATTEINVHTRLSVIEQGEVTMAVEQAMAEENPPQVQQKWAVSFIWDMILTKRLQNGRWVTKFGLSKVTQFSEEWWRDMGMLTLTFHGYRVEDNKIEALYSPPPVPHRVWVESELCAQTTWTLLRLYWDWFLAEWPPKFLIPVWVKSKLGPSKVLACLLGLGIPSSDSTQNYADCWDILSNPSNQLLLHT